MSSDCTRPIKERESWLAGMLPRDGDGERELSSLLATAALVQGAIQAIPVPEAAEAASRERCIALMQESRERRIAQTQEQWEERRVRPDARRSWTSHLGGWLRVVFTLWRRR